MKNRSIRFTLSYEGKTVNMVSAERIEMLSMPSDPFKFAGARSGFWFELQDARNRPLYRRIGRDPIQPAREVVTDDPKQPFTWVEIKEPRGLFTLLAPDIAGAEFVVLFSSPFDMKSSSAPAKEIARFPLPHKQGAR
jgi:hypothetical protein